MLLSHKPKQKGGPVGPPSPREVSVLVDVMVVVMMVVVVVMMIWVRQQAAHHPVMVVVMVMMMVILGHLNPVTRRSFLDRLRFCLSLHGPEDRASIRDWTQQVTERTCLESSAGIGSGWRSRLRATRSRD